MHYYKEIPQNDHTFALLDPSKKGNLMTPNFPQKNTKLRMEVSSPPLVRLPEGQSGKQTCHTTQKSCNVT